MGVYGKLLEISSKYDDTFEETKYKVKGVVVRIEKDSDKTLIDKYIDQDMKLIISKWNSIFDDIAKEYYDYILELKSIDKDRYAKEYKSISDVKKAMKLVSCRYQVIKHSSGKISRDFCPFIDIEISGDDHIPSVFIGITDNGYRIDECMFDG